IMKHATLKQACLSLPNRFHRITTTISVISIVVGVLTIAATYFFVPASSQTRPRTVDRTSSANGEERAGGEVVKVDVDLVTVDALVLQKDTARIVGDLKKDDFVLSEDGVRQTITHFSQDSLPLSVLLLIDRGGCLDPFGTHVRTAALDAISKLKATDEVGVMSYHNNVELLQGFTRDRSLIADALNHVPPHDEEANHCLNKAFADAAEYVQKAGNPIGRRVIVAITGVTRNFDCSDGPSSKSAARSVYESGAVVCGIIPKTGDQAMENGIMIWATRMGRLGGAPYLDIQTLANETGGELLEDKPENLDVTFQTLMNHLRSRYSLAFVSSNKKRDGTVRKLKIDVATAAPKSQGKLIVKARRSYVAPKT
ncbi:MAG TPA: VWA domain-containing protein, partial [Terriglobales bacterium]|nr:VWA domain-containing protein [Terriglobales bacterium]